MTNLTNLPKVRGLSDEQQSRLDVELTARRLTTAKAQRARPNEVVAALQAALGVDATSIMAAYGDHEAKALQVESDMAAIAAVNDQPAPIYVPPKRESKRTKSKTNDSLISYEDMED